MKMFLLAAAAVVAMPAFAQSGSMPQSGSTMPDSATPATPADTMTAPATPTDSANPPGTTAQGAMAAPMANGAGDPVGGYQPSAPPMSGPMQPGATVTFRQAPSPSEAYPAPAPMAHYPVCKPGQFDKCMQGPGSTHSRQVRGRR